MENEEKMELINTDNVGAVSVVSNEQGKNSRKIYTNISKPMMDIMASRQSRKILTGTLVAVQRFKTESEKEIECGVIFYDEYRILIPVTEMNISEENRKVIRSMLGAEIDFIVKELDTKGKMASASRKEAMELRKRLELSKHKAGDKILVRVTGIGLNSAIIEAFGIETRIPKDEIDWGYIDNIDNYLQVGNKVQAVIKEVNIEKNHIAVSIREAKEDPYEEMINTITRNEEVLATITGVQEYGIFLKIRRGINALCNFPHWTNFTPSVGDKCVIRIDSINKKDRKINATMKRVVSKA